MPVWLAFVGAVGATFVLTRSTLFSRLRSGGPQGWRDFISCPLCAGTWVGAGTWVLRAFQLGELPQTTPSQACFTAWEAVWFGAAVGTAALLAVMTYLELDE